MNKAEFLHRAKNVALSMEREEIQREINLLEEAIYAIEASDFRVRPHDYYDNTRAKLDRNKSRLRVMRKALEIKTAFLDYRKTYPKLSHLPDRYIYGLIT